MTRKVLGHSLTPLNHSPQCSLRLRCAWLLARPLVRIECVDFIQFLLLLGGSLRASQRTDKHAKVPDPLALLFGKRVAVKKNVRSTIFRVALNTILHSWFLKSSESLSFARSANGSGVLGIAKGTAPCLIGRSLKKLIWFRFWWHTQSDIQLSRWRRDKYHRGFDGILYSKKKNEPKNPWKNKKQWCVDVYHLHVWSCFDSKFHDKSRHDFYVVGNGAYKPLFRLVSPSKMKLKPRTTSPLAMSRRECCRVWYFLRPCFCNPILLYSVDYEQMGKPSRPYYDTWHMHDSYIYKNICRRK